METGKSKQIGQCLTVKYNNLQNNSFDQNAEKKRFDILIRKKDSCAFKERILLMKVGKRIFSTA